MGVGDRIREVRLRNKVGLRELARSLPVSHATLAEYENGKSRIDVEMLIRIAGALGESPCTFFNQEVASVAQPPAALTVDDIRQVVRDEIREALKAEFGTPSAKGRLRRVADDSTRYGASRQELTDTFGQQMARQWGQLSQEKQKRILEIAEEPEV